MVTTLGFVPASSGNERQPARDGEISEQVKNDFEEADKVVEALYRTTLEVDSSHRWGHNNLGLHFHNLGRNAEVIRMRKQSKTRNCVAVVGFEIELTAHCTHQAHNKYDLSCTE